MLIVPGSGLVCLVPFLPLRFTLITPAYQYCIRTPDYVDHVCNVNITTTTSGAVSLAIPSSGSQTRTATITPTTAGPPAAKLSGQPANCNAWYTIKCAELEHKHTILFA